MLNSSAARLLNPDYVDSVSESSNRIKIESASPNPVQMSGAVRSIPSMDPSLYAVTSKLAGRMNAAAVSDSEHEKLLKERQRLLDKKFNGFASRQELNRLEYIRWSLDRIEDAKHGDGLEALEGLVETYERLRVDIQSLTEKIQSYSSPSRHRKK